ncbi:esterase/lipase family protein [Massilia sp. GCM10020059]|uniref:Alpha/beta fold hydrolase n=1 Tax=Massilia agrisoli TaxID=2892444 RepID=A0ABS8IW62_9BURK|nr:alpha/beta fold hydrolase [Massilia agrisoli]MCC6072872.1 alpha/beta fold hydrolase [Massilia agrisoli]
MSARLLLQLLLFVQAAAAGAIAYALARYAGADPMLALAGGLATVVLVRALISVNNFLMSSRAASPTPDEFRLGRAARLRLFGEEFRASMLQSSWLMPRARPSQRIFPGSTVPPVLLLHGYGCNSGYWKHLLPLLDAARISHACPDLEPLGGDIDGYVPAVARAVDALCAASGAPRVTILGHSMGGLVARAYVRKHGAARVARIITLGTPHHGTSLANLGLGANARQMRRARRGDTPESDWLRALAGGEDMATRALVTSIYSHHDNIVAPQTSSHLAGARNIAFGGVGHVALGSNPHILSCIMHELARDTESHE